MDRVTPSGRSPLQESPSNNGLEGHRPADRSEPSGGRSVSPVQTPVRQLSEGNTPSGNGAPPSELKPSIVDRRVNETPPQPLTTLQAGQNPEGGVIPLGGGGKIVFTRSNGADLPTAKDKLLGEIHRQEANGEIDEGSKSKAEMFFNGASKVLDLLLNNRKVQIGVGLVGIAIFLGAGCVYPVLLIGTGPFIIMFANGFIDNPMLTAPEGGKPTPEGNKPVPEGSKPEPKGGEGEGKEGVTGTKPKSKPDDDDDGSGGGPSSKPAPSQQPMPRKKCAGPSLKRRKRLKRKRLKKLNTIRKR